MLTFHLEGRWTPGSVSCRFVGSSRVDTPAARDAVERAWERMAGDPSLHLYDGPMCRLESFTEEARAGASHLLLDLSITSYRIFLGTNLHGPPDLPTEALANALGVSPALESADGFLLFGRRSARVAYYPHRIHPFGGALEPPPDPATPLDIFAECRRELAEEIGLLPEDVPHIALLGIAEDDRIRHPELILHARTRLAVEEIRHRLDTTEHTALHAVPATPAAALEAAKDETFTPIGQAALRLWARNAHHDAR